MLLKNIASAALIACCLSACILADGQMPDHHLQLFDQSHGIKPGNINAIRMDKKGFLWILYNRKVQRFDGRKVISYKPKGYLQHLLCDEAGRIWITSGNNVYLFSELTQNFEPVPVNSDRQINTGGIFSINSKRTGLYTAQGFFEYDTGRNEFVPVFSELPVKPPYNFRVFAYHTQAIFFDRGGYLYRFHLPTKHLDSLPNQDVMRIYPVNNDSVIISSWRVKSYWLNFSKQTISEVHLKKEIQPQGYISFLIRGLANIDNDRFIMAAREGIFEYDAQAKEFRVLRLYLKGNPLKTNDLVNNVIVDNQKIVWMSTMDGIYRFPAKEQSFGLLRLRQLQENLPIAVDNIRGITEDNRGNIWLATGYSFLRWHKNKNEWKWYPFKEGATDRLAFGSIRGIAWDGKYIILAPTDKGIWLFDPAKENYHRPLYVDEITKQKSEKDFFDALAPLQNGSHLFMGRDGLYLMEKGTYKLRRLNNPAATENTNIAFQSGDGTVWVTTSQGLHCFDSLMNYRQRVNFPAKDKFISAGCILPDDRLLFATSDGLYTAKYQDGKTHVATYSSLFDGIYISLLFADPDGLIWAASENGIYRYNPKNAKLNLFDYTDNVQGYGFNTNSYFYNKEGILFIGGTNGLNYLYPKNFIKESDQLNVYIEYVKNDNQDSMYYTFHEKASFAYKERSLLAEFVAPYFNNPDKLKYRYRLEGFDDEWKHIGNNNQVRFTSLPPGNYRLLVQASTNNADWVNASNSFSFFIKPPFWLQWWFLLICAVTVILILGYFIRNRNKKLYEKQEELEAEQAITFFASRMYEYRSIDTILWDVARNCIGRLQFEDCVIYLVDEERKVLVQKAAYGPKNPKQFHIAEPLEIPLGQGITGWVAVSGKAEIITDTTKDPRYIIDDERRYSEITVPILSGNKVLGIIDCEHSRKGFFTQKHLAILTTIASLCANKIVRAYAQAEKEKAEKALTNTKQRMAEAEMQALRAQMNPHFIFNCLNSINRYIVKSDQATASLYLTRFAKLIRLILDNSNNKTVTLSNELEALKLYIEMESIRFDKKYHYVFDIDETIQQDSVYVPPLIIQPYVENAIWHGLLHKETAGILKITIQKKRNEMLECIVEDNGVGREKAKQLRSKTASTRKSLGMKLTKDRLTLLNDTNDAEANVQVEDLINEYGEAAGTKVILNIPLE